MESAPQAYRRDPGHPTWHHGAFQDVKDSVRSDVRQMLHSRAEVRINRTSTVCDICIDVIHTAQCACVRLE